MSDIFEGPGHWMASDGKWYPPERHPDPSYRERFATSVLQPESVPLSQTETQAEATETQAEAAESQEPDNLTAVEDQAAEPDESPPPSPMQAATDLPAREFPTVGPSSGGAASTFSVASTDFGVTPERQRFEPKAPPRSVVEPPAQHAGSPRTARRTVGSSQENPKGIQLELDRSPDEAVRRPFERPTSPSSPSSSMALAVIPTPPVIGSEVSMFDRLLAGVLFSAGVAMIVGTFLDWTTGSVTQTGWERGDGIATIVAGVLGSACAGPVYVGYRHIIPKGAAIVAGLIGIVVLGLAAGAVLLDSDTADTTLATGFVVGAVGAVAMTIAGLAQRIDPTY